MSSSDSHPAGKPDVPGGREWMARSLLLVSVAAGLAGLVPGARLLLAGTTPDRAILLATEARGRRVAAVEAVMEEYCVGCHAGPDPVAGLALDVIDWDNPGAHAEALEKVLKKLRFGMMPPAGSHRPPPAVYDSLISWIETDLDRAWVAAPNPGNVRAVHRLNRFEYNNAINDLLGLNVDVVDLLPGDPTADGSFDNMAESLPFSTAHLERYLSVARQVTRLAVGLPPDGPGTTTYKIPLHVVQDWRQSEDLPFGSRGGLSVDHHFPVDGEYVFRVRLRTNWQDYIMGMGWPQEIEIRLDGRLLDRVQLGGDAPGLPAPMSFSGPGAPGSIDWENYMFTADEHLEVRALVTAGPHSVGVSYVREQVQPEDIPQPEQRGRLLANDEVYMAYQQVESLEIGGPYGGNVVARDTPSRSVIFSCYPSNAGEERPCASEILSRSARRAFRRPVTDTDVEKLLRFYDERRADGDGFDGAIQFALEVLLSDPEFLARIYERPEGVRAGETYRLSDLQIATRLAFFLSSTLPDSTLLAVAERGELSRPGELERQTRRLMADPRSADALTRSFAGQWLNLRRIAEVIVNPDLYPNYDESLLEAFRTETELFIANSIREDASVTVLIDADYTYVNERLAKHYGIEGIYGSRFRRVSLPDRTRRGGLLAHGSILAVTSYPGRTSPVLRGKWLLDNILGSPPPPPPPNIPLLPDVGSGDLPTSMRERLARHRSDPVCSSCHATIDPLGFALENYDVIGGWREVDEGGNPIDSRGTWPAGEEFEGLDGLRDWLLSDPDRFVQTLTEKLATYALGRRVEYFDQPSLRHVVRDAADENYRWSDLIVGIVTSPAFTTSRAPGE